MDAWLLQFIGDNAVTMGLALAVLKVVAKSTPWAGDDEILQILTGLFTRDRG